MAGERIKSSGRNSAIHSISQFPYIMELIPTPARILSHSPMISFSLYLHHLPKMSSCLGSRKKSRRDGDHQPLLPRYEDDTSLQRAAHQKMHTYQMLRALSKGFMPSTEQTIVNLRTLLASDILNPETPGLSDSGRKLMKYSKQWLTQFIEMLRSKNDGDQIQDFIWFWRSCRRCRWIQMM